MKFTKGKLTTLEGTRVLPLLDPSEGDILYVTDTGKPEIVEVINTTDMGAWDRQGAPSRSAPGSRWPRRRRQVIDGSVLGL